MARDYYAETRDLTAKLTWHGLGSWSQRLTDEMAAGATGTEIVMGLRWTLAQMLETEPALQDDIREQAMYLHAGLDALLR
ncbi:MAG TPA: hypothetical protein VFR13_05480 [Jiangellaceae bacterium]|nr:hypothetical protein [Jiangellaceae bacterium]